MGFLCNVCVADTSDEMKTVNSMDTVNAKAR